MTTMASFFQVIKILVMQYGATRKMPGGPRRIFLSFSLDNYDLIPRRSSPSTISTAGIAVGVALSFVHVNSLSRQSDGV